MVRAAHQSMAIKARRMAAKIASICSSVMIRGGEISSVSPLLRIRMPSSQRLAHSAPRAPAAPSRGFKSIAASPSLDVAGLRWLKLPHDGLEREFNLLNELEGRVCTMCAPGDQRKSSNNLSGLKPSAPCFAHCSTLKRHLGRESGSPAGLHSGTPWPGVIEAPPQTTAYRPRPRSWG